ncbi:FecR domain-containing protein [Methylobacterium sp. 77]|uniref:FecR family protein n=1 Tax=Methylobacterium sp. 77 TaxID=1101192 RepID=UPI000378336D|nr:FecR domain-containing protein [Methylobacterium sp. 77]
MSRGGILEDPRAEAAVAWMVEIASGDMSAADYRAFETWLHEDACNEAAWIRLNGSLMPYGVAARQDGARAFLVKRGAKRPPSRRAMLASFAGFCGTATVGLGVADRFLPLRDVFADHYTRTAQQERVTLPDGSELVLGARTAVDLRYEPGRRGIHLIDGEIMLRVAPRAASFRVDAESLALEATAGTFVVQKWSDESAVTGIEGTGRVLRVAGTVQDLARGQRIAFQRGNTIRQTVDPGAAIAWLDGLLVANDQPVATIVEALRPYFPGVIRLSPAVAPIHATGVFSLKDPNAALDALAESLNLSITRIAGYWVAIDVPTGTGTRI